MLRDFNSLVNVTGNSKPDYQRSDDASFCMQFQDQFFYLMDIFMIVGVEPGLVFIFSQFNEQTSSRLEEPVGTGRHSNGPPRIFRAREVLVQLWWSQPLYGWRFKSMGNLIKVFVCSSWP